MSMFIINKIMTFSRYVWVPVPFAQLGQSVKHSAAASLSGDDSIFYLNNKDFFWGRRVGGVAGFLFVFSFCFLTSVHAVSEFVQVKKTMHEKPSKVKEEIVETLESLLTWSSDMIASIAQEQRLIVQKVREVTQSQGAFEQKNPHELKKYRDSLKKMEEDFEKQTGHIHMQFAQLKKDFSHN